MASFLEQINNMKEGKPTQVPSKAPAKETPKAPAAQETPAPSRQASTPGSSGADKGGANREGARAQAEREPSRTGESAASAGKSGNSAGAQTVQAAQTAPAGATKQKAPDAPRYVADPVPAGGGVGGGIGMSSGIHATEHEAEVDKGYFIKKLVAIMIAAGIVLAVVVAGWIVIAQVRRVPVKDFTGRSIAEMRKWASEAGLVLDEQLVYSEEIDEDTIISQDVEEGKRLSPKSIISVVISQGTDPEEKVEVPNLMTMTAAQIREWINSQNLMATKISEENSDTVARGDVIRYAFGSVSVSEETFRRNDVLTIYVSKGSAESQSTLKMPLMDGKTRTYAEKWATDNKVTVKFVEQASETVADGVIISQNVEAGQSVDASTNIVLTVSIGAGVEVPDFSKISKSEAENYSEDFVVTIRTVYNKDVAYGKFVSQSVAAGERVAKNNNKITVVYSLGRPYIPNLVGRTESEVPTLLEEFNNKGAKLTYETVYENSAEEKGTILSASCGNEYVLPTERVVIHVSRGNLAEDKTFITVPDYSKINKDNAMSAESRLNVTIKTEYHKDYAYGMLISQSVRSGEKVTEKNNSITLVYSLGKPYIPNLVGESESQLPEMFSSLNASGADLMYIKTYVDSNEPKGTIVSASDSAEYVAVGTRVRVQISRGNGTEGKVPDFSGITKEDAADFANGLAVIIKTKYSNTVAYGGLISQSIKAGETISTKTGSITLVYSKGKPYMPNLIGMMEDALPERFYNFNLDGAELTYKVVYVDSTESKGTVVGASKYSEYVNIGEVITIQVSNGKTPSSTTGTAASGK